MELIDTGGAYQRSFAGDVFNAAVYAKRCRPSLHVQMLTAVGCDPVSQVMLSRWDELGVGRELVSVAPGRSPGIYIVSTDSLGERSFTYWRQGSAATQMMSELTPEAASRAQRFDVVFFSGISLAVLSEPDRLKLFELLRQCQEAGAKLAFDPNFRAALWPDLDSAKSWTSKAYQLVDIAFAGLEDHLALYRHTSYQEALQFCIDSGVEESVVKAGSEGLYVYSRKSGQFHLSIETNRRPLDTTGAGDSFAGTYLAKRIGGADIDEALSGASEVASVVIQHRGAIIDEVVMPPAR